MASMLKSKKGQAFGVGILRGFIVALVLVTILLQVAAVLIPVLGEAGNTLNATGAPLGELFVADGIVVLIVMAAILLVVVLGFLAFRGISAR